MLDNVNLNHIRIFECVFRNRSMTTAAQQLHLTQSGVSQHIKSLEDMLEVRLFDRIQQKLVPTASGILLYERCSSGLKEIEQALWKIKGTGNQLAGTVAVGMPIEFGENVIIPLLGKFCKKFPLVKFRMKLGFAPAMNEMLLKGELDFAFVDEFRMDRRIKTENVYDEILELCASEEYLKGKGAAKHNRASYEILDYVDYEEASPILNMWFDHHLEQHKHLNLNLRATVPDAQAMARLIMNDVGAGILPGHLVAQLLKEGHKVYRFKGCGKALKNAISVAYLGERTQSPAAQTVLDSIKKALLT